jgi:hypothetical protein
MAAVTFSARGKNVKHLSYDPLTRVLDVTFHSGPTYTHADVPHHIYQGMTKAVSLGSYYHHVIKVHYRLIGKHHAAANQKQAS